MIRIATGSEMREIDRTAIEDYGIAGIELMENAGKALANEIIREIAKNYLKQVIIICGSGNNGGDGYVAARILTQKIREIQVYSTVEVSKLTGDAKINYDSFIKLGGIVTEILSENDIEDFKSNLSGSGLIVDAIFGTGIKRAIEGSTAEIIDAVNNSGIKVLSVDIPSGISADDGKIYGIAVRANSTLCFQMKKLGVIINPGREYSGKIKIADIGIPNQICENTAIKFFQKDNSDIKGSLPKRKSDMNKGDAGKILLIAGSTGMAGAAILSASGALRSGAGLIKLAAPMEVINAIQIAVPEATCLALNENISSNIQTIMKELKEFDVIAVGPGLGKTDKNRELIEYILLNSNKPVVIDADGINLISGHLDILKNSKAQIIMTPHPGEMARLIESTAKEVNEDRIGKALSFSEKYNVILLLKGANTIIATPGGKVYINDTGNPGMATGGMGDVLTGVIASFLGQGMSLEEAAATGAYVHGKAGDIVAATIGEYGIMASDVVKVLPKAIKVLGEQTEEA